MYFLIIQFFYYYYNVSSRLSLPCLLFFFLGQPPKAAAAFKAWMVPPSGATGLSMASISVSVFCGFISRQASFTATTHYFYFLFFSKINLKFYIQKAYFDFPNLQTQTVAFSVEHYRLRSYRHQPSEMSKLLSFGYCKNQGESGDGRGFARQQPFQAEAPVTRQEPQGSGDGHQMREGDLIAYGKQMSYKPTWYISCCPSIHRFPFL